MVYTYYIIQVHIGGDNQFYLILQIIFGFLLFASCSFIVNLSKTEFHEKHKKCSTYSIFILTFIFRFSLESLIHMRIGIVKDSEIIQPDIERPFDSSEIHYILDEQILYPMYWMLEVLLMVRYYVLKTVI